MEKDSFLDTNVIFNYSNYDEQSKEIVKKCYLYICNKKEKFVICGAVLEELQEIAIKRARIHKVVIDKIVKQDNSFEENSLISKRDIPFAKQLYEKLKNKDKKKISIELAKERDLSDVAVQRFLSIMIDEKVIPIEQIQTELVNKLHDVLSNHADCKILASALQLQKERDIFLFVTADGRDLNPNNYEFIKEQFKINYSKEKYKFPELLNLMFT